MAKKWTTFTYACGCEDKIVGAGPSAERHVASKSQEMCFNHKRQIQNSEQNETSAAIAGATNLPKLVGTEKQIAYAETRRLQEIEALEEYFSNATASMMEQGKVWSDKLETFCKTAMKTAFANDSAKFWIEADFRDQTFRDRFLAPIRQSFLNLIMEF